jgi:hypothetical protein
MRDALESINTYNAAPPVSKGGTPLNIDVHSKPLSGPLHPPLSQGTAPQWTLYAH